MSGWGLGERGDTDKHAERFGGSQQKRRAIQQPITVIVNNSNQPNTEMQSVHHRSNNVSNGHRAFTPSGTANTRDERCRLYLCINITRSYGHYKRRVCHLTLISKNPSKPLAIIDDSQRPAAHRIFTTTFTEYGHDLYLTYWRLTLDGPTANSLPTAPISECPRPITDRAKTS